MQAAGRHRVSGVRDLDGHEHFARGAARVVTATGNPASVEASVRAAGFSPVTLSAYRDHHWFDAGEAERELARARADGASLVLTAKDAVRWPVPDSAVLVIEVEWEWLIGGAEVEARVFATGGRGEA